jgi:hypothetical protein
MNRFRVIALVLSAVIMGALGFYQAFHQGPAALYFGVSYLLICEADR